MYIVRERMTISLSKEERDAMQPIIDRDAITPHALVKACLRWILFPKERDRMPIDGYISMKETPAGIRFFEAKIDVKKEEEKHVSLH